MLASGADVIYTSNTGLLLTGMLKFLKVVAKLKKALMFSDLVAQLIAYFFVLSLHHKAVPSQGSIHS